AADQQTARRAADLGGALDELRDLLELDALARDVVEEEERLGPGAEDVVDAVGGEIHAAPAELAGAALEDELRARAVGRGGEQARVVGGIDAAEVPEVGGARRLDGRPEPLDDGVGRREGHAGGRVRLRPIQEPESTVSPRWRRSRGTYPSAGDPS